MAPHAPPVVHDAEQQLPLPATPHRPLVHWLLPPHDAPAPPLATHVPDAPGFKQKLALGETQSLSLAHDVLHAVALAQMKPPAHGPCVPALQPPALLHVPAGVSMPPEQDALPHEVVLVG